MRPAMKPTPDRHGACRGQRGIAALEFSLTLTMLLMFICAVVGYGVLFWMQQQLAAAANEGARAAVFARFSGAPDVNGAACTAAMGVFSTGSAVGCAITRAPAPGAARADRRPTAPRSP